MERGLNTDEVADPNVFAVDAAIAAFTKGEIWLDELREYIARNKKIAKKFIEREIPQIRIANSQATYLLWLDCSDLSKNSSEIAKFMKQRYKFITLI